MSNPRFDIRFRGVGRVRVSAGTRDPKVAAKMKAMLHQFFDQGRLDLLEAVRDKRITPLQLYNQVVLRKAPRVPTAEEMEGLTGMQAWADALPNPDTRRSYRSNIGKLIRFAGKGAQMGTIADILRAYRDEAAPVVWNRTVIAVRAYLGDRQRFVPPEGMLYHPLYANVAVLPLNKETPREGRPFSVDELVSVTPALGDYAGIAWTMALTGMRRKEYWNDWVVDTDRIHVQSGKGRDQIRPVPYVGYAVKPCVLYQAFRKRYVKAAPGRTVHDLRKTFTKWVDEADIPRIRRKLYLGHSNSDMTDLYERRNIEEFLVEDAERLRAYVGDNLPVTLGEKATLKLVGAG